MGKILVYIFDEMTDCEITFITHLLCKDAGKEIIPISYRDEQIKASSGLIYKPVRLITDVLEEDVEGLIIPGGWNGEVQPELIHLIQKLHFQGKLLGGICGAGTIYFAMSGVLANVRYTTAATEWTQRHMQVFGVQDPFPRQNFVSARVVRDKNIITAQGIAFTDFAVEICDWFGLFGNQQERDEFVKEVKGL